MVALSGTSITILSILLGALFLTGRHQPGFLPWGSGPPPSPALQKQRELARWVIQHGGFVNLVTPSQQDRRMGEDDDFRSAQRLPKGEFTIWRASFSDNPRFSDEDFARFVEMAGAAGSVSHLNLSNTGVTAAGLAPLRSLGTSLTSLALRGTAAFTAESVPFIGACEKLRVLFVAGKAPGSADDAPALRELVAKLQGLLPQCEVTVAE